MITRLIKITASLLIATGIISCSGFLDKEPISDLYGGNFWKTKKDADAALTGMYFAFARAMASGYHNWGEVRGGNWGPYLHNGQKMIELISHQIPNTNSACSWKDIYQAINRANLVIKHLPGMSITNAAKESYLGEAYAMRALCYFYAVRTWGDVPVFTNPVETYDVNVIYPQRTKKETILNLIQSDLQQAESLLPDKPIATANLSADYGNKYRTRLSSKPAVYAIMMDVYAWRHQYDMAIRLFEDKIATLPNSDVGYGLEPNLVSGMLQADFTTCYRTMFDKELLNPSDKLPMSREILFSVYYAETETGTNQTKVNFHSGSQALIPSEKYLNSRNSSDLRFEACFTGSSSQYKLCKYWLTPPANGTPSDNYLPIYRYADMVLLYAEALYMTDKIADAVEQLNRIRLRSGVPAATVSEFEVDQTKLLDAILNERRMEFMGEGKFWFDLIRTGMTESIANCPVDKIYFPIHRDHLLQNPNLELPPL